MADIYGKITVCDRCGSKILLQELNNDEYECADDWFYEPAIGDLCPKCAEIYKNFLNDFMDNKDYEISIKGCKKEIYFNMERAEIE